MDTMRTIPQNQTFGKRKKKTLVPSYSRNLIALKICQKVTFGHTFNNNLWTIRNSCVLNVLESRHYGLEFEPKFCIFSIIIKGVIVIWIWPIEYYPKFGVQLCADRSVEKWKSYVFLTDLTLKYFSYLARLIHPKSKFGKKIL